MLSGRSLCLESTYCLHLQGSIVSQNFLCDGAQLNCRCTKLSPSSTATHYRDITKQNPTTAFESSETFILINISQPFLGTLPGCSQIFSEIYNSVICGICSSLISSFPFMPQNGVISTEIIHFLNPYNEQR
jgi:hypothetical protein